MVKAICGGQLRNRAGVRRAINRGARGRWAALAAAAFAGAPLLLAPRSFAATSFLDLNGTAAGFGTTGAPSLTGAFWTTDATGVAAPVALPAGNLLQIGNVASDFSGQAITLNMDFNGSLSANPDSLTIVSNNLQLTLAGTVNCRFSHAFTWSVAAGSTLNVTDTGNNNGWNFNSFSGTMAGGGTINFTDSFGSNENAATATLTENMTGTLKLSQTSATNTSNFGTSGGNFTLTAGTLQFTTAAAITQTFKNFSSATAGAKFSINGGVIDNTSGTAGTINLGNGTYSIGGNFTFTGTNDLNLGTNAVALTGNRQITVGAGTLTIGGAISDGGGGFGFTKAGAGTLKLTGVNSYAGNTTVSAGTLDVSTNGMSLSGTQTLTNNGTVLGSVASASGTTLKGTGTFSNAVTVSGGTISPGNNGVGTLGMSSLTMSGGALAVELSGATSDQINVAGAADFTGFNGTGITITTPTPLTAGSYQILTAGTLVGGLAPTLATTSIGRTTFSIDNAQLANNIVQIDVGGGAASLVWTGTDGTNPTQWENAQVAHNWTGTGIGDTTVFYDGDLVTFDGTNAGPSNIVLPGTVSPGSMTVTAGAYSFSGGSIAGTGALNVNGTGNLTINTTNTFTGGTNLSAGSLTAAAAGALGTGAITVTGGTLNINNAAALNTAQMNIGNASIDNTSGAAITLSTVTPIKINGDFAFIGAADGTHDLNLGTGAVTLNAPSPTITVSAGTLTVGGAVSGAGDSITKAGNGTLVLSVSSSFSGGLTINAGTVQSNTNNVGTTALGSGNVTVNASGTLVGGFKDSFGFAPNAAPALININGGTVSDLASASYRITLPNLNFTGGTLTSASGNNGDVDGNYSFNGNGTTATVTTNASSTTATISAPAVSMQHPTTFNVASGTTPSGVDLLVSANVIPFGVQALTKSGAGVMLMTGNNTYAGTTTVSGGTLALASSTSTNNIPSSTAITVNSSAIFDVSQVTASGGFTLANTQTLVNNGTVLGSVTAAATGQTVTGTGTFSGPVTISGGTLTPGTAAVIGTIASMPSLSVNGGVFNIKVGGASADAIATVTGAAAFASNSSLSIQQLSLPINSTYTILSAGSISGLTAGLLQQIGRTVYNIDATALAANTLQLDVSGGPAHVIWTGADTATNPTQWDSVQSNANWTTGESVTDPTHFYNGDLVTFDSVNNNGQFNVNLSGTVSPGSVAVTNGGATTYTFSSGVIAGAGSLTMNSSDGTGALTINTSNTYTGGTVIQSGIVNANAAGALSTGAVTLSGGTLNLGTAGAIGTGLLTFNSGALDNTSGGLLTLSNNAQSWAGNFNFVGTNALSMGAGAVTLNAANPVLTVTANTLTVGGAIGNGTGNSWTKAGAGTLLLSSGSSSYTGTTTITGGVVKFTAVTSTGFGPLTGGAVIINGGTYDVSGDTTANNLNFGAKLFQIAGNGGGLGAIENPGGVAQQNAFENVQLTADATVAGSGAASTATSNTGRMDIRGGTPVLDLQGHTLTKIGSSQFTLVGVNVSAGNIVVASPGAVGSVWRNTVGIETTSNILAATNPDASTSTITFNDNTNLETFTLTGTVTRQMVFNGDVLVSNGNTTTLSTVASPITDNGTLRVDSAVSGAGNNGPITLSGNISGAGSVLKVNATGTLTLSGNNSFSGGTTISGGTIVTGSNTALGTAGVEVDTGANLDLGGFSPSVTALTSGATTGGTVGNSSTTAASVLNYAGGASPSTFGGLIKDTLGTGTKTTGLTVVSGSLVLSGVNTYSGNTTVNSGGMLSIASTGGLAPATNLIDNGTVHFSNATPTVNTLNGSGAVSLDNGVALTVNNGGTFSGVISDDPGSVTVAGTTPLTLGGANTYTGPTTINAGATLNVTGSLAATNAVTANGTVNFGGNTGTGARTQQLASLAVASGQTASVTSSAFPFTPATLQLASLSLADTSSKIDLTNNILIAPGAATDALNLITTGQVFSSSGTSNLGYITLDASNFEIRWTLLGDTNLDGKVNVSDLGNLATNFGSSSASWIQGDFDRNGTVNVADLGDLATNFGQQLAAGSAFGGDAALPAAAASSGAASVAAVPEPTSLGLLGLGAASLLARRRRRLV